MANNERIVFAREGEQSPDFVPGDVIFVLKQKSHKKFKRVGDDLFTDMTITLEQALLGFKRNIKHLNGKQIEIQSDNVIQPFEWMIIEDQGMPLKEYPQEFGKLHIKFIVKMPEKMTEEKRKIIEEIFE